MFALILTATALVLAAPVMFSAYLNRRASVMCRNARQSANESGARFYEQAALAWEDMAALCDAQGDSVGYARCMDRATQACKTRDSHMEQI